MNLKKLSSLLAASLFCLSCSGEKAPDAPAKSTRPKTPSDQGQPPAGYHTKKAPYEKVDNHTSPKPIFPDVPPADLLDWQIKATAEASAKIADCKGYQTLKAKNPEGLSITTHKEISPSMPFWIFAIQESSADQTSTLNYCTLVATDLTISCDPVGAAVCP